ncbi:MAG: helix-turn-helix domain-containing protein [Ferruginibacter sp.]
MTKINNNEYFGEQLLDRASAAKYLGGLKPGTLAVWDCTKRYDLKPIKIGKLVRYKRSVLDQFLKERMSP